MHNATDGIMPAQFGSVGWLWKLLHVPDLIQVSSRLRIFTVYPLIPWIAVIAAGYCFGRVMDLTPDERRRILFRLGAF